MKKGRKKKIIIPETVTQHIEQEFKASKEFKKAYTEHIAKLSIAYKIMQLRKLRRLSQTQLAKKMGTTQQTISRLENPQNYEVTLATLSKAALALDARLNIDLTPKKYNFA